MIRGKAGEALIFPRIYAVGAIISVLILQEHRKRHVLMYGLIGGILIAALKSTEYQFRFPKVPVPSGHKFLAHWAWDPATGATSASQEGVAVYPVSVEEEDVFGKV